jgi:hypothetical protein
VCPSVGGAPINQICTRRGLCCHASLDTQNGGYFALGAD